MPDISAPSEENNAGVVVSTHTRSRRHGPPMGMLRGPYTLPRTKTKSPAIRPLALDSPAVGLPAQANAPGPGAVQTLHELALLPLAHETQMVVGALQAGNLLLDGQGARVVAADQRADELLAQGLEVRL